MLLRNEIAWTILLLLVFGINYASNNVDYSMANVVHKYNQLPSEVLLEKGDAFAESNVKDSALICYSLIYNSGRAANIDTTSQHILVKSLNRSALIYLYVCDYKMSVDLLLRALKVCEDIGYDEYISRVYNNMGNAYSLLKDWGLAKKYYRLACKYRQDEFVLGTILSNLGIIASKEGKYDSALLLYDQAYKIRIKVKDSIFSDLFQNIGGVNQSFERYDSAFFYYRKALNSANMFNWNVDKASSLSSIGELHFELGNLDSSMYYLEKSNVIASQGKFLDLKADNFLYLSKIEERRGNSARSLYYHKRYSDIKDSVFNVFQFSKVHEAEFLYNMAKIDKQIRALNVEQEMKERTIEMQLWLQIAMGLALLTVLSFFVMLYIKNKNLNVAYTKLVAKSVDIVNSDRINQQLKLGQGNDVSGDVSNSVEEGQKYQRSNLTDYAKGQLTARILEIMNDRSVFCDPEFSLDILADMVGSNTTYISQIINGTFNKNFRLFLSEYRVKEACKLLADSNNKKYSIETIAFMVGFKSKSNFNPIFKEVTGVTPSFYIKSITK